MEIKKSIRYNIIKYLLQPQIGSGLDQYTELYTPSRGKSPVNSFLPSDPNELVDQLKQIVLEKVGGNNNSMLSEQNIAIVDKILEYECFTTNQHQKSHKLLQLERISLWIKDLVLRIRFITNPIYFDQFHLLT